MKIMQANSVLRPIDPSYSTALIDLIYHTLQRNPDDRPNVVQILATPVVVNAHLNLSTDVGRLPCSKSVCYIRTGRFVHISYSVNNFSYKFNVVTRCVVCLLVCFDRKNTQTHLDFKGSPLSSG